jgi:hypothetical protein
MKLILVILFFICGSFSCRRKITMSATDQTAKKYFYLALGDSYTIGEMVQSQDNFPTRFMQ